MDTRPDAPNGTPATGATPEVRERDAVTQVEASRDWLTSHDELSEEVGWVMLQDWLTLHLKELNQRAPKLPTVTFHGWLEPEQIEAPSLQNPIEAALGVAFRYGGTEEGHHRAWVIDQMVRALTGCGYSKWITAYEKNEEDESDPYEWSEGIPP